MPFTQKVHSNTTGVEAETLQGKQQFAGMQAVGNSFQDEV